MNIFFLISIFLSSISASALPDWFPSSLSSQSGHGNSNQIWDLKNFTTLVTFGDSYTDSSRFLYFYTHNGTAPPAGWVNPPNPSSADGGYPWPVYVEWYSGAKVFNYAVNGASCSNSISPRVLDLVAEGWVYPDVEGYEIGAWEADKKFVQEDGTKFIDSAVDETVYSLWIGTNELDVGEMLTDEQVPGTNITTYMDCVFTQLQRIYSNGGRYFVLQNVIPLFLTPLVATPENGGVGKNHYWPNKPGNITAISYKMLQMVVGVNAIYEYRTPFELLVAKRFPGARFALMDMYGLILDIHTNPTRYLNGTASANATGFINQCPIDGPLDGSACIRRESPDSYLWFDESHPSEQTDRIIARTFLEVVKGTSKWATYWSS